MRLSPGTLVVGIFALLFGLAGAYAVKQYLQPVPQEQPVAEAPAPETIIVPMAGDDLQTGRPLRISDIILLQMTREQMRERNLPSRFMNNPSQIVGRILRQPLNQGDVFTTPLFYPEGTGPTVAERLKPGFRAVTIELDESGAMSGFASPGSMVDVLFRAESDDDQERPETTVTLVSAVEVLALDGNSIPGAQVEGQARTATLAVATDGVRALKIAEGNGVFSLSLRNPNDVDNLVAADGISTLEQLLNIPAKEAPFVSEIYRRGQRQEVLFENGLARTTEPQEIEVPVVQTSVSNEPQAQGN